jgi:hypothetical protein
VPVPCGSNERVLDFIFTPRLAFWFRPNVTQILGCAAKGEWHQGDQSCSRATARAGCRTSGRR